jgi:hypothetical protein
MHSGGEWSVSYYGCFTCGESSPAMHWIVYWVGPRSHLYAPIIIYLSLYGVPFTCFSLSVVDHSAGVLYTEIHCGVSTY